LENPDVGLSLAGSNQLLYKLYRDDIDAGTLTVDKAIELLCCLWLKIGDHVAAIPAAGSSFSAEPAPTRPSRWAGFIPTVRTQSTI